VLSMTDSPVYSEVQWSPLESMWIMWGRVKYCVQSAPIMSRYHCTSPHASLSGALAVRDGRLSVPLFFAISIQYSGETQPRI
jgi:hypothetical protein